VRVPSTHRHGVAGLNSELGQAACQFPDTVPEKAVGEARLRAINDFLRRGAGERRVEQVFDQQRARICCGATFDQVRHKSLPALEVTVSIRLLRGEIAVAALGLPLPSLVGRQARTSSRLRPWLLGSPLASGRDLGRAGGLTLVKPIV